MAEDTTIRPGQPTAGEELTQQREELVREQPIVENNVLTQAAVQTAEGVACPFCGTVMGMNTPRSIAAVSLTCTIG